MMLGHQCNQRISSERLGEVEIPFLKFLLPVPNIELYHCNLPNLLDIIHDPLDPWCLYLKLKQMNRLLLANYLSKVT